MFAKDKATKDLIKETVGLYSEGSIKQFRTAENIIRQLINTKTSKQATEKKDYQTTGNQPRKTTTKTTTRQHSEKILLQN